MHRNTRQSDIIVGDICYVVPSTKLLRGMSPRLLRLRRLRTYGSPVSLPKKNIWSPLVRDFLTAGYPFCHPTSSIKELKEWTETLLLIICPNCRAGCQSSSVSCQTSEPCYQPQQHSAIRLRKQTMVATTGTLMRCLQLRFDFDSTDVRLLIKGY